MIDVRNLTLTFGDRYLFKELSFQLGDKEKICLAGPNGSGKTTLLKILCGEQQIDGGQIIRSSSVKIGFLRQHLGEDGEHTVYTAALQAFAEALDFSKELDGLHAILGEREATEAEYNRMDFLQDELIRSNFYTAESETRTVLAGLGFSNEEQNRPLAAMSGGWRMRVALARVLLSQPTCLFLDEPTNHLDLESIMWLESYIREYSGSMVLISHDRQFVDRTCDRIMEITNSTLTYYPVPYEKYEEEKALRMEQLLRAHKKQQDEIAGLERFVERFKAKASKATLAQSKQKQLDKIERIEIPTGVSTIRLKFPEAPPSGQWVFEVEDLDKAYGENTIFRDGKFGIQRGDHAVLVGPNGAGKTTLLKLIQGIETPTRGKVTIGSGVVIGYFAQYEEPTPAESAMDLLSYLSASLPKIGTQQLRSVLGAMLFSDDDAFKKFGVLSGGERARVRMCRLLLQNCNVLILDEPTNHLDMDSKHLLMRALDEFTGTVIFVSHDRYFVENIATRVILVKSGKVTDYPGDYHYYLSKILSDRYADEQAAAKLGKPAKPSSKSDNSKSGLTKLSNANAQPAPAAAPAPKAAVPAPAAVNAVPAKPADGDSKAPTHLDWEAKKEAEKQKRKAEKRWGEIEAAILGLDQKVSTLDAELCLPETYADQALSTRLAREKKEAEDGLAALYKELEQLEAEGYGGNLEESPLPQAPLQGTLVEVQRRTATVSGDDGAEYHCQYSPTIDLSGFSNFAVGDRVTYIRADTQQESMITGILPRTSKISRPGPMDRRSDELILAANVDALVVVTTPAKPDFNPRMVDRYLALAEIFRIDAIICMNKADLDAALPKELVYLRSLGYPVVSVSAKQESGLEALSAALEGIKVVLSGPSGVGKSSLIRKLIPGAEPGVGDVRKGDGKGRHTTTSSNLYRHGGICIIDTPGIRELGIVGVGKQEFADYWRDFRPFLQHCRFRDCAHKGEPGCAVTEAVASGKLPDFRYQSYLRIQETLEE